MSNAIDLVNDGAESTAELVTCPPVPAALKPTVIVVPAPGEKPEGAPASSSSSSDSNTAGSEFQMSRCVVLRNGALLLPSVQSTSDSWFAVPLPEAQSRAISQKQQPQQQPQQQQQQTSPVPTESGSAPDVSFDGADVPGPIGDDDSDDESHDGGNAAGAAEGVVPSTPPTAAEGDAGEMQDGAPAATTTTMTLRERRKSRTLELRSANALDDVVVEQWELLDPHEAPEVPVRPFRRGRTYRVPKELQDPTASTTNSSNNSSNKNQEAAAAAPTVRIRAPFFTEFDDLYEAEMKRRRAALSTMRREQHRRERAASSHETAQSLAATVMGSAASAVLPATEDAFFEDPYAMMREDVGELDVANPARDDDDDGDDNNDDVVDGGDGGGVFDDVWAQPLNYMDDDDDAHTGIDLSCLPHTVCKPLSLLAHCIYLSHSSFLLR